jgi:hypothetical protein
LKSIANVKANRQRAANHFNSRWPPEKKAALVLSVGAPPRAYFSEARGTEAGIRRQVSNVALKEVAMKNRIRVEVQRLWQMVQEQRPVKAMIDEFNIPNRQALKEALLQIMRQKGEHVLVPGLIEQTDIDQRYSKEGIHIDPAVMESTAVKEDPSAYDVSIDQGVVTFTPKE